jgi:hypothetical protein
MRLPGQTVYKEIYFVRPEEAGLLERCCSPWDWWNPPWHKLVIKLGLADKDVNTLPKYNFMILIHLLKKADDAQGEPADAGGKAAVIPGGVKKTGNLDQRRKCKGRNVKPGDRRSLSPDDEAKVLEKCRRRCCLCFGLKNDGSEKKGQLAHLDHNKSNNAISNFVYLCLHHHDTYDSKTSQSKNLTEKEVRIYQTRLHEAVERGEVPSRQGRASGHLRKK